MKKKFVLLVLCTITCFILTGCTEYYKELKGTVYQKEIKPEETEKKTENNIIYEYTYPERYILYVKYDLGSDEFGLKAFYVSKSIYEATNIGDEYYYNSEKDSLSSTYIDKKEVK